jgi:bifunctional DNA-binding transcriptional regulator/antitoxin component of YhaV-PrlF toxin-antitoxin module
MTFLDSAGRLQLPKEYLEQLSIGKRVRIELVDDGIMIRPAANNIEPHSSSATHQASSDQKEQILEESDVGFLRKLINRIRFPWKRKRVMDTDMEVGEPQENRE